MPCHAAMMDKIVTLTADQTVEDVVKILDKQKADALPVIDEEGVFEGLFGRRSLMKALLPVSVAMSD